jgi:hypothetical protein
MFLYQAWRFGGNDPYRLYHGLDQDYVPLEGDGPPRRPPHPRRLRSFVYACAARAASDAAKGG